MLDILEGFDVSISLIHRSERSPEDFEKARSSLIRLQSLKSDELPKMRADPNKDFGLVVAGADLALQTYEKVKLIAEKVLSSRS